MFDNLKKLRIDNRLETIKHSFKKASPKQRVFDHASEIADMVISKEEKYKNYSDAELKNLSYRIMDDIRENNTNIDNYLVDGLAIAREMIYRTYNMKAFRVQLIGAIVVHFGDFAEMATGEGKTLVLLLVSYVNALTKKGVHIVTVNEYLVKRDAEFSKKALSRLGVTVGYVHSEMKPEEKKSMYNCDITYVSNSELGFDYLRDNMVGDISEKMQRPLNFAIVDEADSVLIDEARTPLIIAGTPNEDVSLYVDVDNFVKSLKSTDYIIDLESQAINLNDNGIKKAEEYFKINNLYDVENSDIVHKIMNSLRAHHLMEIGREYIVRRNNQKGIMEIALVDTFTGRIMDGRMYSAGLHQAIQAKERVDIEPENMTVATITYQSFFRLYKKLSGVSGTALTEKNELLNIYNMIVVDIPTNKPKKRIDHPDYIFATKQLKWKYVVADIKKRHATGQPILVGTVSVDDSEILHKMLDKIGIPHQVLNAKNNAQEAEIVAKAGQKGMVTIATNMAGRGTDIKLGEGVAELGGLFVLGTERNESRRIDNQLRGRSGRQGDPGESRFFISLQDLLFKRFAIDWFDKAQYKLGEDVIDLKFFSRLLNRTQKKVENMNFDIRKNLIDYDYVLSEQRELYYKQRDAVLISNNIIEIVFKMIPRIIEVLMTLNRHKENIDMIDIDELLLDIKKKCGVEIDVNREELKKETINKIYDHIVYALRKLVYDKYKRIGKEMSNNQWRVIIIETMDRNWTKFLDKIQKLRDSVALRSFEQKSPLNIYVEDSDHMFFNMTITIATEAVHAILSDGASSYAHVDLNSPAPDLPLKFNISPNQSNVNENSIDNLPLSQLASESDKINIIPEGSQMNNKSNAERITNVVDEILGDNATYQNTSKDEPISQSSNITSNAEPIRYVSNSHPPIPNASQPSVPPPIPKPSQQISTPTSDTVKSPPVSNRSVPNTTVDNDFTSQVLKIVNNDIKPEQVNIDFDSITGDDNSSKKSEPFTPSINSVPSSATDIKNSSYKDNPTISQDKKRNVEYFDNRKPGSYRRDDDDKYENYSSKYVPLKSNQSDSIDEALKVKEKEIKDNQLEIIEKAKDEQIKQLQEQINSINVHFMQKQLEQENRINDLINQENKELKQIHEKLVETIKEQDNFRLQQEAQIKLLKEEEAKAKMHEELQRKMLSNQQIPSPNFFASQSQPQYYNQFNDNGMNFKPFSNPYLQNQYDDFLDDEYDDYFDNIVDDYQNFSLPEENQTVKESPEMSLNTTPEGVKQLYNKNGIPLRRVPLEQPTQKTNYNQSPKINNQAKNKISQSLAKSYINNYYNTNTDYDDDVNITRLKQK